MRDNEAREGSLPHTIVHQPSATGAGHNHLSPARCQVASVHAYTWPLQHRISSIVDFEEKHGCPSTMDPSISAVSLILSHPSQAACWPCFPLRHRLAVVLPAAETFGHFHRGGGAACNLGRAHVPSKINSHFGMVAVQLGFKGRTGGGTTRFFDPPAPGTNVPFLHTFVPSCLRQPLANSP